MFPEYVLISGSLQRSKAINAGYKCRVVCNTHHPTRGETMYKPTLHIQCGAIALALIITVTIACALLHCTDLCRHRPDKQPKVSTSAAAVDSAIGRYYYISW